MKRASAGAGAVVAALLALAAPAAAQTACGSWVSVDPPAGATLAIEHVSALSADEAWALSTTQGTIRWDGTAWAQVALPDLSGYGSQIRLDALETRNESDVFLAGIAVTGTWTTEQLLLTRNASGWDVIEALELATNAIGAPRYGAPRSLDGVSADDLWIVGTVSSYGDGSSPEPVLTLHWNGSSLTEVDTRGLGNRQNHLYDVEMLASDDGWAVGYYNNTGVDGGTFHSMTLHWDGSSWDAVPNPGMSMPSTFLYDLAAIAPDDVWAVGSTLGDALFMHWDGSSWSVVPSPVSETVSVQKVVAIASDDVWAVDSPRVFPGGGTYYHWDGTAWSVVPAPQLPGVDTVSRHGGLAAVGECDVWAVGSVATGSVVLPYIERLQGGGASTGAPAIPSAPRLRVMPNPLRDVARIRLQRSGGSLVRASIHDVRGRLIRDLRHGPASAGELVWDGRDDAGRSVPGGVYFLRAEAAGGHVVTEKVTVLR